MILSHSLRYSAIFYPCMFPSSFRNCKSPLGSWQAKNWDPVVGSTRWDEFCEALAQPIWKHPDLISAMNHTVEYDPASHRLFYDDGLVVELAVVNYAKYIRKVRTMTS